MISFLYRWRDFGCQWFGSSRNVSRRGDFSVQEYPNWQSFVACGPSRCYNQKVKKSSKIKKKVLKYFYSRKSRYGAEKKIKIIFIKENGFNLKFFKGIFQHSILPTDIWQFWPAFLRPNATFLYLSIKHKKCFETHFPIPFFVVMMLANLAAIKFLSIFFSLFSGSTSLIHATI